MSGVDRRVLPLPISEGGNSTSQSNADYISQSGIDCIGQSSSEQ